MGDIQTSNSDLLLGVRIRRINLHHYDLRMVAIVVGVVAIVLAIVTVINPPLATLLAPLGLIPIAIAVISVIAARKRPRIVEVYERGFRVISAASQETIVWGEVTGVQISRVSETYYVPREGLLLSSGWSIWESYEIRLPDDYEPRHRDECRYVFHLKDGALFEHSGGRLLFGLVDDIRNNVFAKVIPDMIKRFQSGETVSLTSTTTYSKHGLHGTLIRETRHARREISLDIDWGDITRLFRTDTALQITVGHQQPVIVPMSEIINAPGFLKILGDLHEQGMVPAVSQ
jgi:hypothetical protein